MNKRGQFYLIAAMLIIVLILGIGGVMNFIREKDEPRVDDIKNELQIESAKLLEYKALNGGGTSLVEDFIETYSEYVGAGVDIYYIIGTSSSIEAYKYSNGVGETVSVSESEGNAIISVEGTSYSFKMSPGDNFYFVIYQENGDEKYIATS